MTNHFRSDVQEWLRVVVAHANVVDQDADVDATNGLLDAWDVGLVGRGRKVNVDDLGSDPLVLGLDVSCHILKLVRCSADLKKKKT